MAEKTNVPEIRFAGFTDPWEQRKLGDVANIKTGDSDLQDAVPNGLYPFFVRSDKVERSNRYLFDGEAILVPGEGRLGEIFHYINGKFDYHQRVYKISNFVDVDAKFAMYSMMYGFKKHALENTAKATVDSIRLPTLTEFKFRVPCRDEQYQINVFFSRLDNLITLHQRKYDKLCAVKKSMLDKMFPKPGEIEPEIRFAGFTDPWEQRKLGDVATRHDNLRIPITAKDRIPGDTPYYGANGIQDYVEGYTHEGEFVLVAEDGATDLGNYPVQLISGLSWVNNHAHVIKAIPDLAQNRFIMHLIKSMDIASYLVGGTRSKLNAEVLMGIELKLPSNSEQIYIGTLLSTLDSLITLHQRELNLLKNTKKSLLDKMFV